MNSGTSNEEISRQIKEISTKLGIAYQEGSLDFFDYFTDQSTIYSLNSTEPIIGRAAYQSAFSDNLMSSSRTIEILREDIQIVDNDNAVLVSTLKINQENVTVTVRQTQSWARLVGEWKVTHLHTSMIGQPATLVQPTTIEGFQVINERIATVAAVLGVAQ